MNGKRLMLLALIFAFLGNVTAQTATNILVVPRASFTLTDRSYSQIITNSGGSIYSNSPDPVASAVVIFDVPLAATNREAFFRFNQTLTTSSRPWLEIFAFSAPAVATTNVATLPKGFVDSIATNDFAVRQEVDVTAWTKQLAGQRVGLQVRNAPNSRGRMNFSNLELHLVDPETRDATPNVIITTPPPRLLDTNSLSLEASILDVDGNLSGWQLLLDGKVVASEEFATPPTSRTIWANAALTNLTRGSHLLFFKAFSGTNAALSEAHWVSVREPSDWKHRWLGSFGNSGSFYVVDAAGRAHVWGRNESAQLGLGFKSGYVRRPMTLQAPSGLRFRQIVSNTNAAYALTDQSTLLFWGRSSTPAPVLMSTHEMLPPLYRRIAVTDTRLFTIDLDGFLFPDGYGQRYTDVKASPDDYGAYPLDERGRIRYVQIPTNALPVVDYSLAKPLSYAIGSDGQLYSWEYHGLINEIHIPEVSGWRRVVSSRALTLAIDDAGRLWQWGVGFSPFDSWPAPHLVPFSKTITNWLDIAVTSEIAMALSGEGELYAWGRGVVGMWNDPNAWVTNVPELLTGLPDLLDPNATEVAAGLVPVSVTTTTFSMGVAAAPNQPVRIEVSTNLVDWTIYKTVTNAATVSAPFDGAQRFFRLAP
jgi:hypothetical protein